MSSIMLRASLVLVVLVVFGACSAPPPDAAPASSARQRIVGGSVFRELPAVGALTYGGAPWCTGTLVGPRKVVTAAHCVHGVDASALRFVLGTDVSSPDEALAVRSARPHPSYDPTTVANDIGLVTLRDDAPVEPLGVLAAMDPSFVGEGLLFVGYGVTSATTQAGAGVKRAAWMSLDDLQPTTFSYGGGGRNTCSGDSGGPALVRTAAGALVVAGVTSWGDVACRQIGVDTRVDPYLSFLGVSGVGAGEGGCHGETFAGRCDDDTVVWCESGAVHEDDCAGRDLACVFDADNSYYACGAGTAPTTGCQGETFAGRCEAGSVIWCEKGEVRTTSCVAQDARCGWDAANSYYGCL